MPQLIRVGRLGSIGGGGAANAASGLGPWEDGSYFSANFTVNQAHLGAVYGVPSALSGYSFSRALIAYALTSAGVLTSFASGAPRITNRGLLMEPARTNRALWSRDLTNAAWTKTNTTAALTQTGVEGTANAASLITATGSNGTVLQSVTNASTARAISAWVKRVTGTGSVYITADNDTTRTDITASINSSTYTLVQFNQTLANPTFGFKLATSGDAIAVDFVGVEDGTGASSPNPTTTVAVTRPADIMAWTGLTTPYPLTLFVEAEVATLASANQMLVSVSDGTTSNRSELYLGSTALASNLVSSGGSTEANLNVAGAVTLGATVKIAGRFAANDCIMAKNGTLSSADTAVTEPVSATILKLQQANNALQGYSYIKRVAVFKSAFSNAQLQAITT
jgi:hypothetical protein